MEERRGRDGTNKGRWIRNGGVRIEEWVRIRGMEREGEGRQGFIRILSWGGNRMVACETPACLLGRSGGNPLPPT